MRDLNNNRIPDEIDEVIEASQGYFARVKKFTMNNKLFVSSSILLGVSLYFNFNTPVKVEETIVYRDNPDSVVLSKNWYTTNLDEMEHQKVRLAKSSKTQEEIFGVWRKSEGKDGNSVYTVIFEPVKALKYNIKEYKDYQEKTKFDVKEKSE